MKYVDVRDRIKDGDLILVKGNWKSLFRAGIKIVTKSPYTHAGLAVWLDGGLWIAEINGGGNHVIPMSQIKDPFDVFECPVDRLFVRTSILELLRDHHSYAFLELLRIFIYRLTGLITPELSQDGSYVCNEYVARVYSDCGWEIKEQVFWPGSLAKLLGSNKLSIEAEK